MKFPWATHRLLHCKTEQEAESLMAKLKQRFEECKLELHPTKTKIVYCKDGKRKGEYPETEFDFLGYTFRRRFVKSFKYKVMFVNFTPAVSKSALKSMRGKIRKSGIRNRTDLGIEEVANLYNPILRGWINYYGRYYPSALDPILRHFNKTLIAWTIRKYKSIRGSKTKGTAFLKGIIKRQPEMFAHWKIGVVGMFA